jgi:hypothetical protein
MINLASNKRRDFLYIASLPLSVLIPVIVLLLFNNEPLLSFVSIILYFIITSITIALMLLISSLFKNKQHIVLSLIVFFFIYTMFFPTQALKTDLIPYGEIGSAVAILIFLISLFSLLKQHIVKLVFLMLSITLLLTICFPDRSPREIQEQVYASPKNLSSSPNKRYVHIILDQHIGIDGLIINNNQDKQYVDSLYDNYDKYNFDLYPKAYSKFYQTKLSLPSILNFSPKQDILLNNYDSEPPHIKLTKNKLFDYLADNNYRINVYGDYLGWCDEMYPINKCLRYRRTILFNEDESKINKILFVIDNLLTRYRIINIYNMISVNNFLPRYSWNKPVVDSHISTSLDVFEILKKDVLNSKKGEAFFAHLIFPHSPYIYDENCNLLDLKQLRINDIQYDRYLAQVKCSQKKVIGLIDQMNQSGILKESVVVIHSDHGPFKLQDNDNEERKWRKY